MAAETGAGIERLEAVGLALGRVDHFPDVDAHAVAEDGKLVDEADVDVAVGVLEDLFHLGNGRRGHLVDRRFENGLVHGRGDLGAFARAAADDLGGILRFIDQVARIDALGREGKVEVHAALEAGLFEDGAAQLFGRAGIRCGFKHDEHVLMDVRHDALRGGADVADVRLLMGVERRRHADAHAVALRRVGKVGRGDELSGLNERFEILVDHIADIVLPGVDHVYLFLLHIKAVDLEARLCLLHRERQTDIAETDNAECGFSREQLFLESHRYFLDSVTKLKLLIFLTYK